ncbi:unnamed protein product [Lampetra planeri]
MTRTRIRIESGQDHNPDRNWDPDLDQNQDHNPNWNQNRDQNQDLGPRTVPGGTNKKGVNSSSVGPKNHTWRSWNLG